MAFLRKNLFVRWLSRAAPVGFFWAAGSGFILYGAATYLDARHCGSKLSNQEARTYLVRVVMPSIFESHLAQVIEFLQGRDSDGPRSGHQSQGVLLLVVFLGYRGTQYSAGFDQHRRRHRRVLF